MPHRLHARRGSILALAMGLTTVFVTLMVGSMAYVSSTHQMARADELRAAAEDAARTGLEFILGWADQNIDKETKLPPQWDAMRDGDVLDPVANIITSNGTKKPQRYEGVNKVEENGSILGPSKVGEFVVGINRSGNWSQYVTTFKARIKQFRISENMERQFLVVVAGRVRKADIRDTSGTGLNKVDDNERQTIVAERVIQTTLARETLSRYAALIDIDGIQNWVPGEEVDGPVHLNRGYVDLDPLKSLTETDLNSSTNVGPTIKVEDARSGMRIIHTDALNNPGFMAVGGSKFPVFRAEVSATEIGKGNPEYKHYDFDSETKPAPRWLTVNNADQKWSKPQAWLTGALEGTLTSIFTNAANQGSSRYGGLPGPKLRDAPVALPRSVRNRAGQATGRPYSIKESDNWWKNIPDGLYVPTVKFWDKTGTGSTGPHTGGYGIGTSLQQTTGGIYIRGTVSEMRAYVTDDDRYSVYWFQVAGFTSNAAGTAPTNRCYRVVVDRQDKRLSIKGSATGTTLPTFIAATGGTSYSVGTTTGVSNPLDFAVSESGTDEAVLKAPTGRRYPFNGVIYVDCSRFDPALTSPHNTLATTGHILALGDLGSNITTKALFNGWRGELFSSEDASVTPDAGRARPASGISIQARGSIFIQNHLLVKSAFVAVRSTATTQNGADLDETKLKNLRMPQSQDVLALIADNQVVVGLGAPSGARGAVGTTVMASISALGDPAYRPFNTGAAKLDETYLNRPRKYVGSFTTEGLMQLQGTYENYWIATAPPQTTSLSEVGGSISNFLYYSTKESQRGLPGNPMYFARWGADPTASNNPNNNPRGKLVVFGGITQKKRGILGVGNNSFDKRFIFDQRLLTLAPPMFPASVNVVVKTQMPFSPDSNNTERALRYVKGTGFDGPADAPLSFIANPSQ